MGYKYKPNKGVKKRLRVTKSGKLKHNHSLTSHLRSGRSAAKKRHLRRASVLAEGHSKNMRLFLGISGTRPNQIRHRRELAALNAAKAAEGAGTQASA